MNIAIRPSRDAVAALVSQNRSTPPFIHLRVHSAYSLLEGAMTIGKLDKLAVGHGFPAIGLTDTNNLFGILEFSNKVESAGIQPIAVVALALSFEEPRGERTAPAPQAARGPKVQDGMVAFFAMNERGYESLLKLVSRAHLGASDFEGPHVKLPDLAAHHDGLIALTGGPDGPIDRALREGQAELADARLRAL